MRRAALLLAALLPAAVRAERSYIGEARDPERGTLLYEEHHLVRADARGPRERLVLYRCPGGAAFARKQVSYGADGAAPRFALEDARLGYREGVEPRDGALAVYAQEAAGAPLRRATLQPVPDLVIDAGFDEFVRRHWERLRRGESVALRFLVPSRLAPLAFRLRRSGAATLEGAPATLFRLRLEGLLGWFAPDITLGYRDADRRLMSFEGLTNIRAGRDGNLVARITFPLAREAAADPAAWQRALAEPLQACAPGSA